MEINKELQRMMKIKKKGRISTEYENGEILEENMLIYALAFELFSKNSNGDLDDFLNLDYKCKSMYSTNRLANKTFWIIEAMRKRNKEIVN